jgi:hypothetical protein
MIMEAYWILGRGVAPRASSIAISSEQYTVVEHGHSGKCSFLLLSPSPHPVLLGPDGTPLRRYRPGVDPELMEPDIASLLTKGTLPAARKRSLNEY